MLSHGCNNALSRRSAGLVAAADLERPAGEDAGQELWDDENEQQGQRWRPGSRRITHGTEQQRRHASRTRSSHRAEPLAAATAAKPLIAMV
jgi:hypothetical protein